MKIFAAVCLWLTIAVSVLVMWDQARWAVSGPEIAVFGVAALALWACACGFQRLTLSPALVPLAAIVLWGLVQIRFGITVYEWRTKVAVLYWAANAATFFAALQAFAGVRVRRVFFDALLVFAFAVAMAGMVQSVEAPGKVLWLFTAPADKWPQFGPFPYRNQYSAFIELLLPFALHRALTEEKLRLFYALVVAVLYSSVIAAGSRMGFFLVTSEMLAVPVIVVSRHRIRLRALRGTALFFAAMLAMLATAAGPEILEQKFRARDPYAGRREYTIAALEMARDRPATGFGLGTYSTVYPGYARFDDGLYVNQAHDDWAQWAAEGGLPMVLIMLSLAVWSTRRALRNGWGLGVTAIFIHCTVDYPIQRTGVALVMFAVLAAVASKSETEDPKPPARSQPA